MRVAEIFTSIQGEGFQQGRKAVFIRFAGCSLGCDWCDTTYANEDVENAPNLLPNEIMSLVSRLPSAPLVVLTGGEPLEQDHRLITVLINLLKENFKLVQIETNGTISYVPHYAQRVWITVSPKPKANYHINIHKPNEIKIVEDPSVTPELLDKIANKYNFSCYHILQPKDDSIESLITCAELVVKCPRWIVRDRLQKRLGIR